MQYVVDTISSRSHYMIILLDSLRALGGRASATDVYAWLENNGHAREEDLKKIQNDGGTRFHKEVRFARKELYDAGLITDEGPGVWGLSETGAATLLTSAGARAIVRMRHGGRKRTLEQAIPEDESTRLSPTTGPIPRSWTGTVTRNADGLCWTYALRFGETTLWKVGQASDLRVRIDDINRHLPSEIYPERWVLYRSHPWANAKLAYAMEQTVLKTLESFRTTGERVMCEAEEIRTAWDRAAIP